MAVRMTKRLKQTGDVNDPSLQDSKIKFKREKGSQPQKSNNFAPNPAPKFDDPVPGEFSEGMRQNMPAQSRTPIRHLGTSEINSPEIELLNSLSKVSTPSLGLDLNSLFVVETVVFLLLEKN